MLTLLSLPRFGGETAFADALGGRARRGGGVRRGEMMVVWYAMRCVPYVLAQWGSLLVVKLAPARSVFDADGDVDENKKNR